MQGDVSKAVVSALSNAERHKHVCGVWQRRLCPVSQEDNTHARKAMVYGSGVCCLMQGNISMCTMYGSDVCCLTQGGVRLCGVCGSDVCCLMQGDVSMAVVYDNGVYVV